MHAVLSLSMLYSMYVFHFLFKIYVYYLDRLKINIAALLGCSHTARLEFKAKQAQAVRIL